MREPADFARSSQFYHIQSFATDLRVNRLLADRGFDLSDIAEDQIETIHNLAYQCACGNPPKYRKVLAAVICTLAGALIELPLYFPGAYRGLNDSLELIGVAMPTVFEAARGFVASVERHGLDDSEAIQRVVDDCAVLSFTVTGDGIDLENDLIEIKSADEAIDKQPNFLPQLPLDMKLDVFRKAAKYGVTGTAQYKLHISRMGGVSVTLIDPSRPTDEPVQFIYRLPEPPPNMRRLPGEPNRLAMQTRRPPQQPMIPVPARPQPQPGFWNPGGPPQLAPNFAGPAMSPHPQAFQPGSPLPPFPIGQNNPAVPAAWTPCPPTCATGGFGPNQMHGQQPSRAQAPQLPITQPNLPGWREAVHATYHGRDLLPRLPTVSNPRALPTPPQTDVNASKLRRYMAGLGRWLSQVGFEEQFIGEHPYSYALNNPVTLIDPDGRKPSRWGWGRGQDPGLNPCIAAGLLDPNCAGLSQNRVSAMIRCIIGCELDDLPPGWPVMRPDPGHPHGGVGPCRLTGQPIYGGFTYPNDNWAFYPCDNVKAGVSLLCFDIKNRNNPPNSYSLPGDWAGDRPCFNRCMKAGGRPPRRTIMRTGVQR